MELFDPPGIQKPSGLPERLMIMAMALASVFNQIHVLQLGRHPMDKENRVRTFVKKHGIHISFRAGMAYGASLVGPLGSLNRRIVTAIGKPVNIASRLESTGKRNCIHIEKKLLDILDNSVISTDTPFVWHIATSGKDRSPPLGIKFFPFFRDCFTLGPTVIQKMDPVSYKEFSKDTTYLINCVPGFDRIDVCPGI